MFALPNVTVGVVPIEPSILSLVETRCENPVFETPYNSSILVTVDAESAAIPRSSFGYLVPVPVETICTCASLVSVVIFLSNLAAEPIKEVGVTTTLVLAHEVSVVSSVVEEPMTFLELVYPPPFICRKIFTVVIPEGSVHDKDADLEPDPETVDMVSGSCEYIVPLNPYNL